MEAPVVIYECEVCGKQYYNKHWIDICCNWKKTKLNEEVNDGS